MEYVYRCPAQSENFAFRIWRIWQRFVEGGKETFFFFACDETRRSYAVVIGVDVEKNSTLAGEKSNRLGVDLIDVRVRQILCLNRKFSNPSTSRYSYHGKVLNAQSQSKRAEVVREHRKKFGGKKIHPSSLNRMYLTAST